MIQGISAGYGIHINNGYFGGPYIDQSRFDAGRLRMNGNIMEVYTGSDWVPVTNGTTHVELSREVVELLEWAKQKRADDEEINSLVAKYPAVSNLKNQLDMVIALVKDYNSQQQEP
jgi:hypothetical protein